ncbi:hypothetical protein [Microbulbifer sp. SAOS-129_SWC]|uniref:hypothetical protein n=1 Tax=Microbulbifer sp. SAOS-129_SWC TaxID=3145235 RepID=UPI003217B214
MLKWARAILGYQDRPSLQRSQHRYRDAKGQVTTFNYDALGRLTDKYPGSDPAQHIQFDDGGYGTLNREHTGASGDPDFERIYSYDSLQRETARTTQIDGNYGRVKGVQYPDGTIVETLYDDTGRVAEDWDFVAGIKLRSVDSRNASDSITQQHLASDLMVEISQFSAAGLLEARCTSGVAGNCDVSDLVYDQYDSYGNLKHRRNNIAKVDESLIIGVTH